LKITNDIKRKLNIVFVSIFIILANPAFAANEKLHELNLATNNKEVPAEVQIMLDRLDEIKTMDKSNMCLE
jgi:hypothetical protein